MKKLVFFVLAFFLGLFNTAIAQETGQPFARVELSGKEVSVGKPVRLVVTLMVPTNFRTPPEFPDYDGLNLIVRSDGPDRMPVTEYRNGQKWTGASQTYWIYPMKPGNYVFVDKQASGTFTHPVEATAVREAFQIDGFDVSAVVPDGAADLDPLIVADSLVLEQSWDGAETPLSAGDAVTRQITATLTGSSGLFLPRLIADQDAPLVKTYAERPQTRDSGPGRDTVGVRSEAATYVAQHGGVLELPDITVRWFNATTGKIETTTAPGRTLKIDAPAQSTPPRVTLKQAVALLLIASLFALLAWIYAKRIHPMVSAGIKALKLRWKDSELHAAQNVIVAIREENLNEVIRTSLLWMELQGSTEASSRNAFVDSLFQVGQSRFGRGPAGNWSSVDAAFRNMRGRARSMERKNAQDILPPMNP